MTAIRTMSRQRILQTLRLSSLIVVLLLGCSPCLAAEPSLENLIDTGNSLFAEGEFNQAIQKYTEAKSRGLDSAGLHYNLGNAYYRASKYGEAIASFRRALLREAADPDSLVNLKLAREKAKDNLSTEEEIVSPSSFFSNLLNAFSRTEFQYAFFLSYFSFWTLIPLSLYYQQTLLSRLRVPLFTLSVLFFVLAFCSRTNRVGNFEFAFTSELLHRQNAVVVTKELKLFSGNSEQYQVVFLLHEGAEIEIAEQRENWVEVILPNGRKGWAERENFEFII